MSAGRVVGRAATPAGRRAPGLARRVRGGGTRLAPGGGGVSPAGVGGAGVGQFAARRRSRRRARPGWRARARRSRRRRKLAARRRASRLAARPASKSAWLGCRVGRRGCPLARQAWARPGLSRRTTNRYRRKSPQLSPEGLAAENAPGVAGRRFRTSATALGRSRDGDGQGRRLLEGCPISVAVSDRNKQAVANGPSPWN